MNTAVINVRTSKTMKEQAQKVAESLGFSLSSLIKAYLKQLVKAKSVHFSLEDEVPNQQLHNVLQEAERDRKAGKSMKFTSAREALDYLDSVME